MDLLVDIGNTRLKWAWRRKERRTPQQVAVHGGGLPGEVRREWQAEGPPARVFIANVAGDEMAAVCRRWMEDVWRLAPRFLVACQQQMGVVNAYREPQRLGIDRWLALIAAYHRYRKPVLIVDAGSAITLDMADGNGFHQGGLILPGLKMMGDALAANTALPPLSPQEGDGGLAVDTASAMASGPLQAVIALIEKMANILSAENASETVMTGGDAAMIGDRLAVPAHLAPELVMDGLALLAEHTL